MREHLIAFIRAVQEAAFGPDHKRILFTVSGTRFEPTISFGYGYFDGDKVFYRPPNPDDFEEWETKPPPEPEGEMEVEAAVDRFLKAHGATE